MNINDILNNFSSEQLSQINDFLNSAQGQKLKSGLSGSEKLKLLEQFSHLDPNLVKKKLNGLTKEDILRMLK